MKRDYSDYSVPELQEALATIDARAHPENHAALEQELQARKDSGEFDRHIEDARQAEKEKRAHKVGFARTMRKVIGAYLVLSAVYAIAGVSLSASSTLAGAISLAFMVVFLVASFASGVGLLLRKDWAHWTAVAVLGLQLLKIQFPGFSFAALSLVGIYVYVDGTGAFGITATLDPGFAVSVGQHAVLWVGLNVFVAVLLGYLFTARERVE